MSFPPVLKPRAEAPVIDTDRLRLRPHTMADFDPFWAFYQGDRAAHVSVPQDATQMWYGLASEVAGWQLCGFGGWAVDLRDGPFIGQVALIKPPIFPEIEIGWILFDGHEGQGYAYEAARAALDWTWANLPLDTLVSYIDPANARSRALAERLGASVDPDAPAFDDGDLIYRHRRPAEGSPS